MIWTHRVPSVWLIHPRVLSAHITKSEWISINIVVRHKVHSENKSENSVKVETTQVEYLRRKWKSEWMKKEPYQIARVI